MSAILRQVETSSNIFHSKYILLLTDDTREGENSSLIHMSVVDTARGVRRSSVVVIEHVSEVPALGEEDQEVHTHIFV